MGFSVNVLIVMLVILVPVGIWLFAKFLVRGKR